MWVISDGELQVWQGGKWEAVSDADGPWPDGDATWFGNIFLNIPEEVYRQAVTRTIKAVYDLSGQEHLPNTFDGDADGNVWLGTDTGAVCLADGEACCYGLADGLPSDLVLALYVEPDHVWVGTDQGLGLGRRRDTQKCKERWTWTLADWKGGGLAESVRAIARGADGSLWVGTKEGLWRLPPEAAPDVPKEWLLYTSDDGLVSSKVNALWADDNGQLWVGTSGGLSGLDDNGTLDKTDDVWVSLTTADGLVYNRVTALWRDADGALWIETGTNQTALIRHVPTHYPPALQVTAQRSRLSWWRLDVGAQFHGDSLVSDDLAYRYRLPGQPWARTANVGWVETTWTPGSGDSFTIHAFDTDLNQATLEDVKLNIPWWQRPWGFWWFRLLAYAVVTVVTVAVIGQRPLGRWWRDLHRASYRETWEISFIQTRPDQLDCTVIAQQYLKTDLRLSVERVRDRQAFQPLTKPILGSQEVPENLQYLHQAWHDAKDPRRPQSLDTLARALSGVLFPERLTRHLRSAVERPSHRIRLRLNFLGAPALAAYPWELAGPPDLEHLGVNLNTAVSRWLPSEEASGDIGPCDLSEALDLLDRDRPLKLLLVVAAPEMPPAFEPLPELEIRVEMAQIESVLKDASVTLDKLIGVRAGGEQTKFDMQEELKARLMDEAGAPDVVHFIGHAGPYPGHKDKDEIVLYLEDQEGVFFALGAARLAEMIRHSQKRSGRPKLLILNACQTATVEGGETLAGLAPLLLTQTKLLAVVGMQYPIRDKTSALFSTTFYRELLKTQPLDYAISQARYSIWNELCRRDWAAPVLYMRVADGMIYER